MITKEDIRKYNETKRLEAERALRDQVKQAQLSVLNMNREVKTSDLLNVVDSRI